MSKIRPGTRYYIIVILIFVAAVLAGYAIGVALPAGNRIILQQSLGSVKQIQGSSATALFIYIFLNNSTKALLSIFLGIFFGIFPLIFIYLNGMLVGLVYAWAVTNINATYFWAATLPHGIIEMTAIITAATYGAWLGGRFLSFLAGGTRADFRAALRQAFLRYFLFVLPLLLVAALIEAYITPKVLQHFLH